MDATRGPALARIVSPPRAGYQGLTSPSLLAAVSLSPSLSRRHTQFHTMHNRPLPFFPSVFKLRMAASCQKRVSNWEEISFRRGGDIEEGRNVCSITSSSSSLLSSFLSCFFRESHIYLTWFLGCCDVDTIEANQNLRGRTECKLQPLTAGDVAKSS